MHASPPELPRDPLTARSLLRDLRDEFVHPDRGIGHTLRCLVQAPGATIRRYLDSRDPRLTRPVRLLMIVLTPFLALLAITEYGSDAYQALDDQWRAAALKAIADSNGRVTEAELTGAPTVARLFSSYQQAEHEAIAAVDAAVCNQLHRGTAQGNPALFLARFEAQLRSVRNQLQLVAPAPGAGIEIGVEVQRDIGLRRNG